VITMKKLILPLFLTVACASGPKPTPPPPDATPAPSPTAAPAPVSTTTPDEAWRAMPPKPGADPEVHLPALTEAKLGNGLTVMVYEQHNIPLVSFAIVTRAGSAADPVGKSGITSLAYNLLDEGAGDKGALALADAVADLGASLGSGATQDRGLVGITGLIKNAEPMMALLSDVVRKPRLDPKDFERIKGQTLAGIVRSRGSPQGLAFEFLPAILYGEKHPYGHPVVGYEPTVTKLTLADAKGQLDKLLAPEQSVFIAVGDITLDDAKKLAEKHFGAWKKRGVKEIAIPAAAPRPRTEITVIDMPGAPQTFMVIGRPIFGRGHADEIPFAVVNEIFGGSFASRLNLNLREDKGYTYGAFSAASARRGVGSFYAGAQVRADVTIPSVKEMFGELDKMKAMPPTAEEILRAQDGLVRSLPGDFQRLSSIAGQAADLFVYKLPADYLTTYVTQVRAVTEDTAAKLSNTYLTAPTMQMMLVGDAQAIVPEAGKLELGKVVVKH